MNKTKNGSSVITALATLAFIGVIAVVVYFIDWRAIPDYFKGQNYVPTSEMQKIIDSEHLTENGLRILKATKPTLENADNFNQICYTGFEKEASVLGCYTSDNVYVYNINNEELAGIKEAVLAHELLHAIWSRTSESDRSKIKDDLSEIYLANKDALGDHMSLYEANEYYDELHSIIGSQIPRSKLTEELRQHYAKYFEDTDIVVNFFNSYDGKFKELEKRAETLKNTIEKNRARIDALSEAYQRNSESFSLEVDDFNNRASSGYFSDMASFYAERADLINRQNQLSNSVDELNRLISETNEMINEYNSNITQVGNLYESLDSRKEKVQAIE